MEVYTCIYVCLLQHVPCKVNDAQLLLKNISRKNMKRPRSCFWGGRNSYVLRTVFFFANHGPTVVWSHIRTYAYTFFFCRKYQNMISHFVSGVSGDFVLLYYIPKIWSYWVHDLDMNMNISRVIFFIEGGGEGVVNWCADWVCVYETSLLDGKTKSSITQILSSNLNTTWKAWSMLNLKTVSELRSFFVRNGQRWPARLARVNPSDMIPEKKKRNTQMYMYMYNEMFCKLKNFTFSYVSKKNIPVLIGDLNTF